MSNAVKFNASTWSAGQPTVETLSTLAGEGVRTVINLRGLEELRDFDENALVRELGLDYVSLPIAGPQDIDDERIRAFGALYAEAQSFGDVLIHCATGNRVGAMVALDAAVNKGVPSDEAIELGRRAGLSALEPFVRNYIQRSP